MSLQPFLSWLENTAPATAIRESASLFPWLESIHVLAITAVVGLIAVVDLRLLGFTFRERRVSDLMDQVLPLTRAAFVVAVFTGIGMFVTRASEYMQMTPFLAKLALLGVALINIWIFHLLTVRDIEAWDTAVGMPAKAKLAGGTSLALWVAITACGRWIGFV